MVDLAGMKQCSSSSLLHHAFEDSVIPGVGRVGDMKVVATTEWTRINAGKQQIFICIRSHFHLERLAFNIFYNFDFIHYSDQKTR